MIIYSGPLHHCTLSCTKTSIAGDHFRRECELFARPRNYSLSNFTGFQSLQMTGPRKSLLPRMAVGSVIIQTHLILLYLSLAKYTLFCWYLVLCRHRQIWTSGNYCVKLCKIAHFITLLFWSRYSRS